MLSRVIVGAVTRRVELGVVDGTAVTHVRATDPADVDELRREARRLEAAAGSGVVAVLGFGEGPEGATLTTAWVPGGTLADALPLGRARAVRIAAGVATTLAGLHARGITHGRLAAEHVLLDAADQPVLSGFSPDDPGDPAADVAALGDLLERLTARSALETLRLRGARSGRPDAGQPDWDLLALAERARRPGPERPTAAVLASALHALTSSPAGEAAPTGPPAPGPVRSVGGRRRLAATLAAGGGLCLVGMVLVATAGSGSRPRLGDPVAASTTAPPASAPAPTTTAPPGTTTAEPTAAPPTTVEPEPEREPEAEPAAHVDGNVVTLADGRRFEVGEPGDLLAVGDWDCDGEPTAALLRPATGEVFVFTWWPLPTEAAAVQAAAVVPGATTLQPRLAPAAGPGCRALVVRSADGAETAVPA